MAAVFPFSDDEQRILNICSTILQNSDSSLFSVLTTRMRDLKTLGKIVERSGSVQHDLLSTGQPRNWETLAEKLSNQGVEEVVNLPVKATLGRSMVVTKLHLWGFLYKIAVSNILLFEQREAIRTSYHATLFSLMAEDLYRSCLAGSNGTEVWVQRAAKELIHVWEERKNVQMTSFVPLLQHLWRARETLVPSLGTLLGSVELLQISMQLPSSWHGFLDTCAHDEQVVQALDEFLFSLSYEQQQRLLLLMKERGISSISRQEAKSLLRLQPHQYLEGPNEDDFATIKLYRSFVRRNNLARSRRDGLRSGPQHTLEQYLSIYLWSLTP